MSPKAEQQVSVRGEVDALPDAPTERECASGILRGQLSLHLPAYTRLQNGCLAMWDESGEPLGAVEFKLLVEASSQA